MTATFRIHFRKIKPLIWGVEYCFVNAIIPTYFSVSPESHNCPFVRRELEKLGLPVLEYALSLILVFEHETDESAFIMKFSEGLLI